MYSIYVFLRINKNLFSFYIFHSLLRFYMYCRVVIIFGTGNARNKRIGTVMLIREVSVHNCSFTRDTGTVSGLCVKIKNLYLIITSTDRKSPRNISHLRQPIGRQQNLQEAGHLTLTAAAGGGGLSSGPGGHAHPPSRQASLSPQSRPMSCPLPLLLIK
jgi:hypothetical protein